MIKKTYTVNASTETDWTSEQASKQANKQASKQESKSDQMCLSKITKHMTMQIINGDAFIT